MKRDDDLLREILLDAESQEDYLVLVARTMNSDRRYEHHIDLLCDAGLMTAVSKSGYRLTNAGYDYIEAVRNETIWNKTKDGARQIGGATLAMMKDLAIAFLKQEAAEKLGIRL